MNLTGIFMFKTKANNDLPVEFIRYFKENEDVHNYDTDISLVLLH